MSKIFVSEYYETETRLEQSDVRNFLNIYERIAEEQGFSPEAEFEEIWDNENIEKLDHVLYHIETFGKEDEDYELVQSIMNKLTE